MWRLSAIALTLLVSMASHAQTVKLWPGVAPGSEHWTQKEQVERNTPVGTVIINVVQPTLTAYLPERGKATGAGVVIAPGGAFVALAIDREGNDVARWLQSKGIAAFVLKYRTMEKHGSGIPPDIDMDAASQNGVADGVQAIKLVRQHAVEWGVAPNKVGMVGFSAGGMLASAVLLQNDASARPNFAALIYGAPFGRMPSVPAHLPPVFMAWAQDDPVARDDVAKFYGALMATGNKPEAHIYSSGGHGFGMKHQGTTSDEWIDEFHAWMEAQGFTHDAQGKSR